MNNMSKIVKKLEMAVSNQNWQDVCDAYKLITGKEIFPPKTENQVDLSSLNKKDLYKLLKQSGKVPFIGPIAGYELDDLRILYDSYIKESFFLNDEVKSVNAATVDSELPFVESVENYSSQPDHTYISKKNAHKILNIDKKPIRFVLSDFQKYGDEPNPTVKAPRINTNIVEARCRKCNKTAKVNKAILIRGIQENERTYICEACG